MIPVQVSNVVVWTHEKPFKDKEQGPEKDTEVGLLVCRTWIYTRFITHSTDVREISVK